MEIKADGPPVLIKVNGGLARQCFLTRTNPPPTWAGAELMRDLAPISIVISNETMKVRLLKKVGLIGAFNTEVDQPYSPECEGALQYFVDYYTLSVKPEGTRFQIDLVKRDADGKETIYRGLAQFEADCLRICWTYPEKDRPTTFPGEGCVNLIMKRSDSK
jgi:hypothetical protein